MALIEVNNISKNFVDSSNSLYSFFSGNAKTNKVLENLSFQVNAGEMLGVLGRNGAGKSTLLRCINGIYTIDSGKIVTRGNIASVFELGSFFNPELTGEQYCNDYMQFMNTPAKKKRNILLSVFEFTGLGDFFYKPVRTYSSGMKAKLLFAVATSVSADIILIDEVLVVGDEYFQAKAWRRMREFLNEKSAGIIVTHDWTTLLKLCERTIILNNKKIEFMGKTYKAIQRYVNMENSVSKTHEMIITNKNSLKEGISIPAGKPIELFINIKKNESFKEPDFNISFSIDRIVRGLGWNQVLSGNATLENLQAKDEQQCRIYIEQPELSPGNYFLGISLNPTVDKDKKIISVNYDIMHWLNGNEILLNVTGEHKSNACISKKFQWSIKPIFN